MPDTAKAAGRSSVELEMPYKPPMHQLSASSSATLERKIETTSMQASKNMDTMGTPRMHLSFLGSSRSTTSRGSAPSNVDKVDKKMDLTTSACMSNAQSSIADRTLKLHVRHL